MSGVHQVNVDSNLVPVPNLGPLSKRHTSRQISHHLPGVCGPSRVFKKDCSVSQRCQPLLKEPLVGVWRLTACHPESLRQCESWVRQGLRESSRWNECSSPHQYRFGFDRVGVEFNTGMMVFTHQPFGKRIQHMDPALVLKSHNKISP